MIGDADLQALVRAYAFQLIDPSTGYIVADWVAGPIDYLYFRHQNPNSTYSFINWSSSAGVAGPTDQLYLVGPGTPAGMVNALSLFRQSATQGKVNLLTQSNTQSAEIELVSDSAGIGTVRLAPTTALQLGPFATARKAYLLVYSGYLALGAPINVNPAVVSVLQTAAITVKVGDIIRWQAGYDLNYNGIGQAFIGEGYYYANTDPIVFLAQQAVSSPNLAGTVTRDQVTKDWKVTVPAGKAGTWLVGIAARDTGGVNAFTLFAPHTAMSIEIFAST